MTSRTSSCPEIQTRDLQIELSKRRLWIIAASILAYVCYFILGTILVLARARRIFYLWYGTNPDMTIEEFLQTTTSSWLGMGSSVAVITVIIAVLTGFAAFSFLYRTQSADFYLSQPITRKRQFLNIYLNGMGIFVILSFAFTLIGMIVAAGMRGLSVGVLGSIALNWLRNLILFAAVYNTTILAVLICKNLVTAIAVTLIFLAADPVSMLLNSYMKGMYYATYYDVDWMLGARLVYRPRVFSPIVNHIYGSSVWTDNISKSLAPYGGVLKFDLMTLAFALVIGGVVYLAYINRKAEDIGTGLIHPVIKNVLKLIVAIPLAMMGATAVDVMMENSYGDIHVLSVVVLIFVAAIVCMATEMICAGRFRAAVKSAWYIAIAAAGALLLFCVYKKDLTGYDRFIPEITEVEDCALFKDYSFREVYDEDGSYMNSSEYYLTNMHLTDVSTVTQIAAVGQETQRHNAIAGSDENVKPINGNDAVISYHMKNGKYVVRYVTIPEDYDAAVMDKIVGSDEYRRVTFAVDRAVEQVKENGAFGLMNYNVGYDYVDLKISADAFAEFGEAYKADLKQYDYSLAFGEYPVGTVTFSSDNSNVYSNYFNYTYEVYAGYTNTLEFLKAHELYLDPRPDPGDISQLDIYMSVFDEDTDECLYECEAVFNDRDMIEAVAPYIITANWYEWKLNDRTASVTVSNMIRKVDGADSIPGEYYGQLRNDDIPQEMKDILYENITYDYRSGQAPSLYTEEIIYN